jgi:hypothetical protein
MKLTTPTMTGAHGTVRGLMRRIENIGHKLYMDNFYSSSELLGDLHTKAISCCGTVAKNKEGLQKTH